MVADVKDYGAFWFAQITKNGKYQGFCQRATKAQLMAALKVLWGKLEVRYV